MKIKDVYLIAGKRTAIANFCGSLKTNPAHKLTKSLIISLLADTALPRDKVDEVIIGQVLTAGCGQNPARQAAIEAGIPHSSTAWTINQMCASGLKSIVLAAQSIMLGANNIVIAGGQESMSMSPHAANCRNPTKMGAITLQDLMLKDGLTDAFGHYHMGVTAENLAKKYQITREEQDLFAYNSQKKAAKAIAKFAEEIVPIEIEAKKSLITFSADEFIRTNASMEALSALKPAFAQDGTVTAGNSSGINDGAACVVLANEKSCKEHNLRPILRLVSASQHGVDPALMGIGPVKAIRDALSAAGWRLSDLDLIELNEAFAAQVIAVGKEIGWDESRLNVNGGAIALGHPIGASGTRCVVSAMREMQRSKYSKGLISLCAGGGMGMALCVERV